jgi:uncharacterized protein
MRPLIDGSASRQAAPSLGQLRSLAPEVIEVCRRNGASNVWVFGSVARGEQGAESDLDLVVDFEQGRSLFDLAGLVDDLESLLGCPVNVVTRSSLRDNTFGRAVRRDMVPL